MSPCCPSTPTLSPPSPHLVPPPPLSLPPSVPPSGVSEYSVVTAEPQSRGSARSHHRQSLEEGPQRRSEVGEGVDEEVRPVEEGFTSPFPIVICCIDPPSSPCLPCCVHIELISCANSTCCHWQSERVGCCVSHGCHPIYKQWAQLLQQALSISVKLYTAGMSRQCQSFSGS